LLRQTGQHLLAIFGPLPLENFLIDSPANLPIELSELGIDHAGHSLACGTDQFAHDR
jgi:hypothetical protein